MKRVLVSGLVNTETTVRVRKFPIDYYPIDYPFFGVDTAVSGVACNIALALGTLEDDVTLASMTGRDFPAEYIRHELEAAGLSTGHILPSLSQTPSSVVLYDGEGRRQVYCDLKDIQETAYGFEEGICGGMDLVVACNINFSRPLLRLAKAAGKPIATDVHVLSRIDDDFNREFMEYADILFLSDEGIGPDYRGFLRVLAGTYGSRILVLGRGGRGAAMYLREDNRIYELPALPVGPVVNTVGAGDALFSAFVHFYARNLPPLEALARAELFASAKIRFSGAAKGFVTGTELEALYRLHGRALLSRMKVFAD